MVKMDIVLKSDPDGVVTVAIGSPVLYQGDAKDLRDRLSGKQINALKAASDMILKMLDIWTAAESARREGATVEDQKPLVLVSNPIASIEVLVNDMKHNPTNDWSAVKRKLLQEISGRTFRVLSEPEIEEYANA